VIFYLDSMNGDQQNRISVSGTAATKFIETGHVDASSGVKVLAIASNSSILLFPSSAGSINHFVEHPLHYYIESGDLIQGYKSGTLISSLGLSLIPTWSISMPGETIAAIAKPNLETTASLGRVLGDRSVLFKYLNPNLITVITVMQASKQSTSFVYLIDAMSGKLHSRIIHLGAGHISTSSPSVFAIMRENFVIYSFWNHGISEDQTATVGYSNSSHYEVAILELYESTEPNRKIAKYDL
jgi:hypothetical protein